MANQKEMSISDFNLEKLSTKQLQDNIQATLDVGGNLAVFGRRGTGKTKIALHQVKQAGMTLVYMNLAVLERVDLGGYPEIMSPDPNRKYVKFLLPSFYEMMIEGDQKVVAVLDEVDKADPSCWAPLLEFVQFRSINGRHLKNLHATLMTGNLISEGGNRPCLPLLDRTEKYLVEADVVSWLDWAGAEGKIHPSVTAYLRDNPDNLCGAADPQNRYGDPSPRAWENASNLLWAGEKLGWSTNVLMNKVCGCVGKSVGVDYSNYYTHYQVLLPMVNDVYEGRDVHKAYDKLTPSEKLICCMIICSRMANQLDESVDGSIPNSAKYVGRFMQQITFENVLVAVRSQIQLFRIVKYNLDDHPDWSSVLPTVSKKLSEDQKK